jgi:hypothetical protein
MNMNVQYRYFDSPEQEQQARDAVGLNLRFLPFWVAEVFVDKYQSHPDGASAKIISKPEYRYVQVELYDRFFAEDHAGRVRSVCHEFFHALQAPLTNWMLDRVIDLFRESDPRLYALLRAECTEKLEAVTQDFSFALCGPDHLEARS